MKSVLDIDRNTNFFTASALIRGKLLWFQMPTKFMAWLYNFMEEEYNMGKTRVDMKVKRSLENCRMPGRRDTESGDEGDDGGDDGGDEGDDDDDPDNDRRSQQSEDWAAENKRKRLSAKGKGTPGKAGGKGKQSKASGQNDNSTANGGNPNEGATPVQGAASQTLKTPVRITGEATPAGNKTPKRKGILKVLTPGSGKRMK